MGWSERGLRSLKLWDGSAPQNWTEVETRGQRIISAGPVRTLVEVSDLGVNGYDVRTLYTLWAGHREVEVCVSLSKPLESTMFCTGVQKYGPQPESIIHESEGIAASWGKDYPEQSSDKAKEQFPPEAVGLAVYIPADYRISSAESDINCLFTLGKKVRLLSATTSVSAPTRKPTVITPHPLGSLPSMHGKRHSMHL